jgi:hypothetical protein
VTRRARIVAAQAVLVAVLSVVIILTLLRPDGDNSFFGVDPPHGDERVADPAEPPREPAQDDPATEQQRRPGTVTAQATPVPGTATTVQSVGSAAGPGSAAVPGGGRPGQESGGGQNDEDRPDSPTGDQYSDTATRIAARLASGS